MNFQDRWETDEDGKQFVFTVELQRRLYDAGLPVEPSSISDLGEADTPPPPKAERRTERKPKPKDEPSFTMPKDIQIDPMSGKYIGRIKWYNVRKGYGFIVRGGGEEIFFHKSGSSDSPIEFQDGQWVLYDVEDTQKGPEAMDVELYENDQLPD